MPEVRCDLILLGWTAFVGFNLLSDVLWGGSGSRPGESGGSSGSTGAGGLGPSAAEELYRGSYRLERNGTIAEEGDVRLTLASQQTSVVSVQLCSISVTLIQAGSRSAFTSMEADLRFSGVEFGDVGILTAEGASNPSHTSRLGPYACRLDASINLLGPDEAEAKSLTHSTAARQRIAGQVAATDCGYSLSFTARAVDIAYLTQKVAHYSIWANLLTIFQIRCFLIQMRHTEEGPSAAKVSILCIAGQALMDAYDSFLHLCLGLSSQYMFNTIAVVSLFKFFLFSLLEARYLLSIWRQRYHEVFSLGWDAARRELSWLYSRFYGVLLIGLVLIYNNLQHLDLIVLIFQAYWVPQIVFDMWQGSRSALRPAFFVGISVTRMLLVLYLWGCPRSIFSGDLYPPLPGAPSARLCGAVVVAQAVQVAVMALQQRWGPRFFVPWICMPWAYNYFNGSHIEPGTDCVICMGEIDPEDGHRVTTPCSHIFHRACLEQWMEVKMECPTCRATLPPIQ